MTGRIENLTPWPKGVSGNPGGRPKRDVSAEIAQAVFENNAEAIYEAMARALTKGNPRVFATLANRAYGKVTQPVEVNHWDALAEMLENARKRHLAGLSEDDIRAQIAQLEEQLSQRQNSDDRR